MCTCPHGLAFATAGSLGAYICQHHQVITTGSFGGKYFCKRINFAEKWKCTNFQGGGMITAGID
jgi:hypothetical protein